MKSIVYYISSHGFGHLTRSLAIALELLIRSDYHLIIVCDDKQLSFAKRYLSTYSSKIVYHTRKTDIGLIQKDNSLEIDTQVLIASLNEFVDSWHNVILEDQKFLKKYTPIAILTDISPLGPLVAKVLDLPCIAISNFTWVDLYAKMNLPKTLQNAFEKAYQSINLFIEYPLRLPHQEPSYKSHKVGYLSRNIDSLRVKALNRRYKNYVLITVGKSLTFNSINVSNSNETILLFEGVTLKNRHTFTLPLNTIDTQNYVAASEFVITKAGWSTVAEALIAHVPMVLIERPDAIEDTFTINALKKARLAISIKEKDLETLNIDKLRKELQTTIDFNALNKIENSLDRTVDIILKEIN